MPPKRKKDGTTPCIMDAFNKIKKIPQPRAPQQPQPLPNVFEKNEIIDLSESQEEENESGPSTSNAIPSRDTVKSVRKWTAEEMKRMPSSVRRSLIPSLKSSELRDMGCDVDELKVIEVSTTMECIEEDVQLVRKLISSNCAIIYPKRATFIVAFFLRNFLRIFPVGRICISSPEDKWFEALKEECSLMGIDKSSFTHIDQGKIPPTSRLMLTNNRLLSALISDPLSSNICCIIFYILGSQTQDKLKSAVNAILLKKMPCRLIVIGGGGSIGGKGGAISRRQTMITTLHLSEWIEPQQDLFRSVIKPRLEYPVRVWTWKETDNPLLVEVIDQMEEVVKELIGESGNEMSEINPRDLIFAPLNVLSNQCNSTTGWDDTIVLLSIFYHLFSYGKTAFEKRLAAASCESGDLEMKLLSSINFTRILASVNELEGDGHRKINLIKEIIHKAVTAEKGNIVKGVILVDSPSLVEAMTECLSMICRIIGVTIYPMGSPLFPLSRISTVLQSGGVAILSIHNQEGITAFQTISSSHLHFVISTSRKSAINVEDLSMREWHVILHESKEKIRGRIEEEEKTFEHERMETAFSLNHYIFHYERSSLSLDASSAVIRLSAPEEKGKVLQWNGISLNPKEKYESEGRGMRWRMNRLPLTLNPSSLLWNESLHSSKSSQLSRRLVSSISPFFPPSVPSHLPRSLPSPSLPCDCTPSDGQIFYSSLISKLSHLFP